MGVGRGVGATVSCDRGCWAGEVEGGGDWRGRDVWVEQMATTCMA